MLSSNPESLRAIYSPSLRSQRSLGHQAGQTGSEVQKGQTENKGQVSPGGLHRHANPAFQRGGEEGQAPCQKHTNLIRLRLTRHERFKDAPHADNSLLSHRPLPTPASPPRRLNSQTVPRPHTFAAQNTAHLARPHPRPLGPSQTTQHLTPTSTLGHCQVLPTER